MKHIRFLLLVLLAAVLPLAGCKPRAPQESHAQTLKSYLGIGKRANKPDIGEIRFEYYGPGLPTVGVHSGPAPWEAVLRGASFTDMEFERLLSCSIMPESSQHLEGMRESYSGILTISLDSSAISNFDVDAQSAPRRVVRILFYFGRDTVCFDGKCWRIDPGFWDWLHDSFPFAGIDIHRKVLSR